ncbi:MAG: mechanosensitive ion channel domain-containing protein [Aestuariivirga sp.]
MFDLNALHDQAVQLAQTLLGWLESPQFYAEVIATLLAWILARILTQQILTKLWLFNTQPTDGRLYKPRAIVYSCRDLLRPILLFILLAIAIKICEGVFSSSWLVRLAQSAAVISLLYVAINRFLKHPLINAAARWVGIPMAALFVFGFMPQVIDFLDGAAFEAGNIRISLLAVVKAALFGGFLLWIGRVASTAGHRVIGNQDSIDLQTRELAAKAFDLVVIAAALLLFLNLLGMDLRALAVLGGAIGVGLGFGLQQITSNFISGIIILLERNLKLGDFIELEDGKSGKLRALNMRSSTLETFDGKEIMVPNEKFITTKVTNWTHNDPRQRYEVPFAVTYESDPRNVQTVVQKAISKTRGVLQKPFAPICEIQGFGENGIIMVARFWVQGLDEGNNSFTSEVATEIWLALNNAGIEFAKSKPVAASKAMAKK